MTEPGLFEAFYASPWQHPIALWLAALVNAALGLARRDLDPTLRRYVLALTGLSLADAWLTSTHVYGIGALPAALAAAVPLFFVLAGDFRYLLLWEAATPDGAIRFRGRGLLRAAALSVLIPIFAWLSTIWQDDVRVLYLVHELAFCALALALARWHPRAPELPWVRAVSRFVLIYYGLWALSDAIILATGSDLGFALRVIPNLLYYGGLLAVIARLAPPGGARAH